jgi:hypothetical protein
MLPMMAAMDVVEVRRRNLLILLERADSARAFADRIDRAPSLISRWKADKTIGDDIARHIERCLKLVHGWLDHPQGKDVVREDRAAYQVGDKLTPEERALVDNYRASDPRTRRVVDAAAAAGAKPRNPRKSA